MFNDLVTSVVNYFKYKVKCFNNLSIIFNHSRGLALTRDFYCDFFGGVSYEG